MPYKIPLARPYFDSDELKEVRNVLDSGWVTQGPKVKEFEKGLSQYLGIDNVIAVSNCTSALHLALLSIGITKGDEILVADYTFPATGNAVLYCNARPVFVDIDPNTYNIDPSKIEKKITNRTKAVIPVHTFGQPADMGPIMRIASKHKLKVIEDAACALGATYKDKFAGTIGDIGCFSFHARKGITTGEGGVVVTKDKALAKRIRSLSIFGQTQSPWEKEARKHSFSIPRFEAVGYNYKMSDITAAVGVAQLKKLGKIIKKKRALAKYWDKKLKGMKLISPPFVDKNLTHAYQSYVALVDKTVNRNKLISRLIEKGVQANIGTYALHAQPIYGSRSVCPSSLDIFNRSLALPIYFTLNEKDIDKAAKIITETLED